jgi:hypothetical protein
MSGELLSSYHGILITVDNRIKRSQTILSTWSSRMYCILFALRSTVSARTYVCSILRVIYIDRQSYQHLIFYRIIGGHSSPGYVIVITDKLLGFDTRSRKSKNKFCMWNS